jgi:hypothetical protein
MANEKKRMAPGTCSGCGNDMDDVGGCLTKTPAGWQCGECIKWEAESGALDLDEWDEKRRQRLAEQQEY